MSCLFMRLRPAVLAQQKWHHFRAVFCACSSSRFELFCYITKHRLSVTLPYQASAVCYCSHSSFLHTVLFVCLAFLVVASSVYMRSMMSTLICGKHGRCRKCARQITTCTDSQLYHAVLGSLSAWVHAKELSSSCRWCAARPGNTVF